MSLKATFGPGGPRVVVAQPAKTWTNPSKSGGGDYTTVLATDGRLLCNCRGWTIRKGGAARMCTHTKAAAAELGGTVDERGEFAYLITDARPGTAPRAVEEPKRSSVKPRTRDEDDGRGRATVKADEADGRGRPPSPMLASALTEPVTAAMFDGRFGATDWRMEEKLDGHRCVVEKGANGIRAFSRPRAGGVALTRDLPPHITAELRRVPAGIYDGELVASTGKAWDVVRDGAQLVLVLFDVLALRGKDLTGMAYHMRRAALLTVLATLPPDQVAISTVESVRPTWAAIAAIWTRGGEGVILKHVESVYRPGKRSTEWIKVKQAHAATLRITGYQPGKSGPYSTLQLEDAKGRTTTVKTPDSATWRAITANPDAFIGRRVVISYQEVTPAGAYRHGVFDHFAGKGE